MTIEGLGPIGTWDRRSGGAPKSNRPKHRPGGMGPEVLYTSLKTYDNNVVERVLDNESSGRHDSALYKQILPLVGNAAMTVVEQPLDPQGNAVGDPTTYTGGLEDMDPGISDSESETPRMWSLTQSVVNVT